MNGAEHYRRAEALLDACQPGPLDVDEQDRNVETYPAEPYDDDKDVHRNALMAAQVHATLALTAATIEGTTQEANEGVSQDFLEAIGYA